MIRSMSSIPLLTQRHVLLIKPKQYSSMSFVSSILSCPTKTTTTTATATTKAVDEERVKHLLIWSRTSSFPSSISLLPSIRSFSVSSSGNGGNNNNNNNNNNNIAAAAAGRNDESPSAEAEEVVATQVEPQYVHPLSQLVLEHLQTTRYEWIQQHGLDRGLQIQRDGTFVLRFPSTTTTTTTTTTNEVSTNTNTMEDEPQQQQQQPSAGRIWTFFEPKERKHWLTVHRGDLVGRYMLQDNTKPAWHDGRSTPEKNTKRCRCHDRQNQYPFATRT